MLEGYAVLLELLVETEHTRFYFSTMNKTGLAAELLWE